jgi:P-type E1-E2 ATPase
MDSRFRRGFASEVDDPPVTAEDQDAKLRLLTELVPGDVVRLAVGDVVAADLRLLRAGGLECDEAVLTGESQAARRSAIP